MAINEGERNEIRGGKAAIAFAKAAITFAAGGINGKILEFPTVLVLKWMMLATWTVKGSASNYSFIWEFVLSLVGAQSICWS